MRIGISILILEYIHMIDNSAIYNFQDPITFEMGLDIDCYPYFTRLFFRYNSKHIPTDI